MTTLAHITDGGFTTNGTSVACSGWGTGTRGLCAVVTAWQSGGAISHTVEGGGVQWDLKDTQGYAVRRYLEIFESDGTPDDTNVTITSSTGGGSYIETYYSFDEVAEWSGTNPVINDVEKKQNTTTTLTATTLGSPTGSEIIYLAGCCEDANNDLQCDTGTDLAQIQATSGDAIRGFITTDCGADNGPAITCTVSDVMALIAVKLSDGATGSHFVPSAGTNTTIIVPTGPGLS